MGSSRRRRWRCPPVRLAGSYDVVIIGAGIGGLMTAAGLARAGKQVLVLEQMNFIGGKYTHLTHQDYAITTAAWTCPGPKSRIGKLCTKLEAPIEWVTIHDKKARGEHWIVTKDGRRFDSTDQAQEALVGGAKGMAKVYDWISDMYNPKVDYPPEMTARQYIERYFPGNEEYVNYVQTIITYCFASQTVDTFSAVETKRAIVDALEQMADWGTAVGGTAAIVDGLERVILHHQGQIVKRTRVEQILIEDGRAVGVRLHSGQVIRAEVVIHNGGLNRLVELGRGGKPARRVCSAPAGGGAGQCGGAGAGLEREPAGRRALAAAQHGLGAHAELLRADLLRSRHWRPQGGTCWMCSG